MNSKNVIVLISLAILAAGVVYYIGYDQGFERAVGQGSKQDGWQVFDGVDFTFQYPPELDIQTNDDSGGSFLGESALKLSIPKDYFPNSSNTNYIESFLVISSSSAERALNSCLTFADVPNLSSPDILNKNINGIDFKTQSAVGAAAGNTYTSHLYRTVKNTTCYEAALTVHTGNLGNYTHGTVTEFNKQLAFSELERVLATLELK